jgi:hypothetical protein
VQTEQNNTSLQIRCNTHTSNSYAWSVNPLSPTGTINLFANQGDCGAGSNQAGNLFNDPDCPSPGVAQSHILSKLNFIYSARTGSSYNANEIPTCVSNGSGGNATVIIQSCGPNSNINACAPPCTGCGSAQAMMSSASTQTDGWKQQNLYNEAFNQYLKESNPEGAIKLVKEYFKKDPNLYLGAVLASNDVEAMQIALTEVATNEETKDVVSFYEVMAELQKTEKTILDLDEAQEAKLVEIADGKSLAKYLAQNTLEFAKGYKYERPVEIWKEENFEEGSGERNNIDLLLENSKNNWLLLTPNPTSGNIEVRWNSIDETGTLEVYNINGILIMQQKIALQSGSISLSLDNHPVGVYVVHLRTSSGNLTQKLIIE